MSLEPARESFPAWIPPMLLSSGALPTSGEGWGYELKWDGMRVQLAVSNGKVHLRSRNRHDWTDEFPELHELAAAAPERAAILDGELVCLDADGKPDFEQLRSRLVTRRRPAIKPQAARLMVFDVLHLDGWAVRDLPYRKRRDVLAELTLEGPAWCTPRVFDDGEALARVAAEHRLEGVVAKRLDRAYAPGRRSTAWVKHKLRRRTTCVITGIAPRRNEQPEEFFLARVHNEAGEPKGRLRPAGRASFGLSALDRGRLLEFLGESQPSRTVRRGAVRWLAPTVAVEVDHHGSGRLLRDPILRSWRPLDEADELTQLMERSVRD